MVGRFIAQVLFVEAIFMLPALVLALASGEMGAARAFGLSLLMTAALAGGLYGLCRNAAKGFYAREGMACVGLSWIVMSLLGAMPFWISREIPHFIDAFFEIVSGFTTTGSSILPNVEVLSTSMLYWRSFSHWLGGMGILVFVLAIATVSGGNSGQTMHLLRAESPGPNVGKLVPKMRQTAAILYLLYIVLTILNIVFLLVGGMPLFDAVCTAFGTAGTGGFGIRADSIASYSPYIQNVCTVFMMLFGVNFSCYYMLLIRQFKSVWRDEELRLYLGIMVLSTVLIAWNIRGYYQTTEETVRHAAFQVSSIMTTTGFATTDFDQWPSFSKTILLLLMMVGASAGSTGGGFKCGRFLFLLKNLRCSIRQTLNPNKVQVLRNNGQVVDEKMMQNVNLYLGFYMMILLASFLVISIDGFSITTNLSAVLACFNNIGPGLEAVGPTCSFASYSVLSKLVLIFDMLAGRLEIFPILLLFARSTWKNR